MKIFRFDYNYKMFFSYIIMLFLSLFFFYLSIEDGRFGVLLLSTLLIVFWGFSICYGYNYGVKFDYKKKYIRLRTGMHSEKIDFTKIKHIYYYELKRIKGHKLKNFFPYVIRKTNFLSAKYIFNEGKVFMIVIQYKNGWEKEIEFPWMYKEKSKSKVQFIEEKLKLMINEFNDINMNLNVKTDK